MTQTNNSEISILLAKAENTGDRVDLANLWRAALRLPKWHFLTKHTADLEDRKPFIGIIDNQPWVFVFTDRGEAQKYAADIHNEGFTEKNGEVMIISMDTDKAIDYILALHAKGVYGMRINEGNGWFSPILNLTPIIEYVNKN